MASTSLVPSTSISLAARSSPSQHRRRGGIDGPPPSLASSQLLDLSRKRKPAKLVCALGDVSSEGTGYLIAGAVGIALVGTAFPILFSRKDLCPECDGAGFVRKGDTTLRANAARKDQAQIVCARCNGLGKLGQIDK